LRQFSATISHDCTSSGGVLTADEHDRGEPGQEERARPKQGRFPKESPLFAGVGVLCETAERLADVDGVAVAVLMSAQSRELVYATDEVAQQIDDLQFAVGEGHAYDRESAQTVPYLATDERRNRGWHSVPAS
jgi:hypothetical protein